MSTATRESVRNGIAATAAGVVLGVLVGVFSEPVASSVVEQTVEVAPSQLPVGITTVAVLGFVLGGLVTAGVTVELPAGNAVVLYLAGAVLSVTLQLFVSGVPSFGTVAFVWAAGTGFGVTMAVRRLSPTEDTALVVVWLPVLGLHLVALAAVATAVLQTGRLRLLTGVVAVVVSIYAVHRALIKERAAS